MPNDPLHLWAKRAKPTDDDPSAFHPLLCHLIDVGAVAERLWEGCLPASAKTWFAAQVGLAVANAGRWAVCLAATHDVGKGSPAFQDQLPNAARHGTISAHLLESALHEPPFGIDKDIAKRLARVVGGHHGIFPRAGDLKPRVLGKTQTGLGRWEDYQRWLLAEAARQFLLAGTPPPSRLTNVGAVWLAGFISVADWIGSNRDFFRYAAPGGVVPSGFSIDFYAAIARVARSRAIAALGWSAWPEQSEPRTFLDLFPDYTPNVMQEKVIALAGELSEPFLIIIEAPMGMGKTEAALYLADNAAVNLGARGHYLALPTQATSNQMFERDVTFLKRRYPGETVNTQLLHGHAALDSEFAALKDTAATSLRSFLETLDISAEEPRPAKGEAPPGVIAAEWFTYRKRGLLAPYGVGTIDQALLAVLQTKHFFVRLLGLAGKTIVFDEVHAYDAYMSVLLERLLKWLAALGCSVVLLSATLPAARREGLLQAWPNLEATSPEPVEYPAISWRSGARGGAISFEAARKPVRLRWMVADDQGHHPDLGPELNAALENGGCAAVICNTVKRAQETYEALRGHFTGEELSLFHARFLYEERMRRERAALRQFGKPGKETERPWRSVIVATQVIEQSLDLDFDLMVTELAPVDLVLQRSGRLHRHTLKRPSGLEKPELWLLAPREQDGLPMLPDAKFSIYDRHVLLRSWLQLRNLRKLVIPADVSRLIEAVYDDERARPHEGSPGLFAFWEKTREQLEHKRREHETKAETAVIYPPGYRESGFLEQKNKTLEEDDPGTHETLRALTRLGESNITAVCLLPEEVARLEPEASDIGQRAADLLQRSVNLTHAGVMNALVNESTFYPASWKRTALLRHCRLVKLNEAGWADIGGYRLSVDPRLGVVVNRDGSSE